VTFNIMEIDSSRLMRPKKRILHFLSRCILPILLFLATTVSIVGCDSNQYGVQANELIASIHTLLISEKLCSDRMDCSRKQYVFYKGSSGVYITVYGIADKSLVQQIVDLCIEKHSNNPKIYYELTMHAQKKNESGAPFLKLILD
jgi:hypothetical protein